MRKFWMGILVVMIVCLVAGRVGGGASPFGTQGKLKLGKGGPYKNGRDEARAGGTGGGEV